MEDRARTVEKSSEWKNVKDLIESAIYSYRLPRWKDQDKEVMIFSEKDAVYSVVSPLARKYHIMLSINRGYNSASNMYELSKKIANRLIKGKEIILLYLGDHDSSGLDMIRDIQERVEEFLEGGHEYIYPYFRIIPVALTMKQIRERDLPPNPAKTTDPRAKWYIEQFGNTSWELDALKPEDMAIIVEDAIRKHIDMKKYNAWKVKEQKHKRKLKEYAKKLLEEEGEEIEEDKPQPYEFFPENIRTKIMLYRLIEDDKDEFEDKGEAEHMEVKLGSPRYHCPICYSYWGDRDSAFNCVFEHHDKKEFDEIFNSKFEDDKDGDN
jgi:hypothetical protein